MELRQLKYFVEIAQELHFGRAAKKLFVSQSALSQQIKLLETELGTELFVGVKRAKWHKVELTEAGTLFLADARQILQLSEKAIRTVQQISSAQQSIKLGIFKLILPERIIGMLELFSTHFPDLKVKLVELANTIQVQEWVADGRVDLGMTVSPLVCEGLSSILYAETGYSILMNEDHPLATQKGVLLKQLQHEKWIDVGRDAGIFFGQAEEICRLANFDRTKNISQQVPTFELLKSMVRLGKGIAFIPATLNLQQETKLVAMPILNADGTPFNQIAIQHIVIYKLAHSSSLIQSLVRLLKTTHASLPFSNSN